jgi:hypothetical protein
MSGNLDLMRESAMRVMKKNRGLLDPESQGAFWRYAYAGVLTDYAKWEYRAGRRIDAVLHLLEAFMRSPVKRFRLVVGLLLAVISGELARSNS